MADWDLKQAAHEVVALAVQADDLLGRYSGSSAAVAMQLEAQQEFCKNNANQREQILNLWTNAKPVTDGYGHRHGVFIKNIFISNDCPEK